MLHFLYFFCLDRTIVAEYEKTVAQMIGKLLPPSGGKVYTGWTIEDTNSVTHVYVNIYTYLFIHIYLKLHLK